MTTGATPPVVSFERPSQLALRCRTVFGVSARAEILATMLSVPRPSWIASELAGRVGLAKKVIASALHDLELGGVVRSKTVGNRLHYDFPARQHIEALVGPAPARSPPWATILPFVTVMALFVERSVNRRHAVLLEEARRLVVDFGKAQKRLGRAWTAPDFDDWPAMVDWLVDEIEGLASGRAAWLAEPVATVTPTERKRRRRADQRQKTL